MRLTEENRKKTWLLFLLLLRTNCKGFGLDGITLLLAKQMLIDTYCDVKIAIPSNFPFLIKNAQCIYKLKLEIIYFTHCFWFNANSAVENVIDDN